jgi:hypothetical protein
MPYLGGVFTFSLSLKSLWPASDATVTQLRMTKGRLRVTSVIPALPCSRPPNVAYLSLPARLDDERMMISVVTLRSGVTGRSQVSLVGAKTAAPARNFVVLYLRLQDAGPRESKVIAVVRVSSVQPAPGREVLGAHAARRYSATVLRSRPLRRFGVRKLRDGRTIAHSPRRTIRK